MIRLPYTITTLRVDMFNYQNLSHGNVQLEFVSHCTLTVLD